MVHTNYRMNTLQRLEAESIHIIREVVAEFEKPVMLYSIGKDSSVMLHLALKAFAPGTIPFPLLHVDTTYKFPEMIQFRESLKNKIKIDLHVSTNNRAIANGVNPWDLGTVKCCAQLKTQGLLEALKEGGYDAAFGGARRDEEKSRAKERIFSFRDKSGQWTPKNQRPELWSLYNGCINQGESIRVFPISNWTELDVWSYIKSENIAINPLYFAQEREVIVEGEMLIPYKQGITPVSKNSNIKKLMCRFRTLGCWPCTGAIRSNASTLDEIIAETMCERNSERITRIIDHDQDGSMEQKKEEGYF